VKSLKADLLTVHPSHRQPRRCFHICEVADSPQESSQFTFLLHDVMRMQELILHVLFASFRETLSTSRCNAVGNLPILMNSSVKEFKL
jgi:hypothetical protein